MGAAGSVGLHEEPGGEWHSARGAAHVFFGPLATPAQSRGLANAQHSKTERLTEALGYQLALGRHSNTPPLLLPGQLPASMQETRGGVWGWCLGVAPKRQPAAWSLIEPLCI